MQYPVNIMGPTGIVNATIYKTEPICRSQAYQSVLILTLKIVLMVTSIFIQIRTSEDYVYGIWQ